MSEFPPTILIADDQPEVLEALELLLKSASYETHTASSPSEVLKALEDDDFDVLLMDLNYNVFDDLSEVDESFAFDAPWVNI